MFQVTYKKYTLFKKHPFRIAGNVRDRTPAILLRIKYDDWEGYGEASLPPRYGESFVTAEKFIGKVDLSGFKDPFNLERIVAYIDGIAEKNPAIKAAFDIALHDLMGKILNIPVHSVFGLSKKELPTAKTIGIDNRETILKRVGEAEEFSCLKIKLGGENDAEIMEAVRQCTGKPLFVDANEGWKTKEEALEKIQWLKEKNVVFIEQPLPHSSLDDLSWLAARSPLPIIGDEGVQRYSDLRTAPDFYHGINIKLMKSTGLREAYKMAVTAKMMGLKILLGCMSETSCAIAAACQLGVLADWIDLDGNLGIKNDPFSGHPVEKGIIKLNNLPGIGLEPPNWDKIEQNE